MAFGADCGVSTVLEEIRVASTARRLAMRPSAAAPRRSGAPGEGCSVGAANSKFEIRNLQFETPPFP